MFYQTEAYMMIILNINMCFSLSNLSSTEVFYGHALHLVDEYRPLSIDFPMMVFCFSQEESEAFLLDNVFTYELWMLRKR